MDFNDLEKTKEIEELDFLLSDIFRKEGEIRGSKYNFICDSWYHGGCDVNYITGCIGFKISCSDYNKNYIKEIRNFNEEQAMTEYYYLLPKFLPSIDREILKHPDLAKDLKLLKEILETTEPVLYEVEASS